MALKTIEEYDPTLFSTGSGSCLSSSNIQAANPNHQQQVAIGEQDVGEDAGVFNWKDQSSSKWIQFGIAVSCVLGIVNHFWISPTGWKWGEKYKSWLESLAGGNSTWTIVYMLGLFSFWHSGLASLRPFAEKIVGPRVFRYIFAFVSLPFAFSSIVYFINHR
jgi:zeta-carotene isomerase